MAAEGKPSRRATKEKEGKKPKTETEVEAEPEQKAEKKQPEGAEVGSKETVSVGGVAEVTEPLEVVETEEAERDVSAVQEVRTEEIEQELRELKPKQEMKILVGPPRITRFEKARIIGARALQLSLGAPTLVPVAEGITDSITLATYEVGQKALPISLRRVLPNGQYQDIPIRWLLEDRTRS